LAIEVFIHLRSIPSRSNRQHIAARGSESILVGLATRDVNEVANSGNDLRIFNAANDCSLGHEK
ncbi:MAG: hypothetical protein ABGX04_04105, partial [Myxococcales bacterium]